jgi:hypothetical protein
MSARAGGWDGLCMTTRRIIGFTAGGVAALAATALLAAGTLVLWGNGQKNDDGYIASASHTFTSDGYAIATDDLDVDEDGAGDLIDEDVYGHVRLEVEPNTDRPVFVGVARTADVDRYLAGSAHSELTDLSFDPFRADYRAHDGDATPLAPASRDIWTASVHGSGPQTLTWKVRQGGWSIVVMNADGSRGVDAGVSVGADVPILGPLGWGLVGGGVLLALIAAGLVVVGVRSPSRPAQARQPVTA